MYLPSEQQVQTLLLERFQLNARQMFSLHALAPMMLNEAHIMREIDYMGQSFAALLYTYVAKGDTTHESKTVEFEYTFKVFKTWLDHFKFDIIERRVLQWLPNIVRKKLRVQYIDVTKKRTESYPISVIRVCPHATFSWDKAREQFQHIKFLAPDIFNNAPTV